MTSETITAEEILYRIEKGQSSLTGKVFSTGGGLQLKLSDCTVTGDLDFNGIPLAAQSIVFENVDFQHVVFAHGQVQFMSFKECHFSILIIQDHFIPETIHGNKVELLRLENFSGNTMALRAIPANRIVVADTTVSADLARDLTPLNALKFDNCDFDGLRIYGKAESSAPLIEFEICKCRVVKNLVLFNWKAANMLVSETELVNATLQFDHCTVSHLKVEYIRDSNSVICFTRISFTNSFSTEATSSSSIQSKSSIQLTGLDISDLRFEYCDWAKVPMWIGDLLIGRVRLQGSTSPKLIQPNNSEWKEVVDLYGMFEAYARNQGHTADAISNRSLALRAYRRYLKRQGRDPVDRFTLWLSEFISDFGSNWLRSLTVLLTTGIVLFTLLLLTSDERFRFGWDATTSPRIALDYFVYFLEFLSPIHSSSFLDVQLTQSGKLIDVLSRIWTGFVIYQLVRSTRKFVG